MTFNKPLLIDIPTKRIQKHMMVPSKPLRKRPSPLPLFTLRSSTLISEITLEGGGDIVGVGKVKVFGHVHLFEDG